jgi:RNA polymerase sigma-70 factor (ECF subfamily)
MYDLEVNLSSVPDKLEIRLIEAAVDGDIGSFGKLCQRYYAAMAAIAYCVLGDHQLAEDAAQESFARALVRLRSLRNRAKFATWLAAICRNVAKDMVATKARQIGSKDISEAADRSGSDDSLQAVRQAVEQLPVSAKELVQAVEQLPVSAKELVILRYYDGLSYEEISSVLGISKATINGRLTRAKRKMAKYLKRNGFLENQL